MKKKAVVVPVIGGLKAKDMRAKSGLNQTGFWAPLGVTQSGGSRYEAGRAVPRPTQLLLTLKIGSKKDRLAVLETCGIDLSDIAAEIVAMSSKKAA